MNLDLLEPATSVNLLIPKLLVVTTRTRKQLVQFSSSSNYKLVYFLLVSVAKGRVRKGLIDFLMRSSSGLETVGRRRSCPSRLEEPDWSTPTGKRADGKRFLQVPSTETHTTAPNGARSRPGGSSLSRLHLHTSTRSLTGAKSFLTFCSCQTQNNPLKVSSL